MFHNESHNKRNTICNHRSKRKVLILDKTKQTNYLFFLRKNNITQNQVDLFHKELRTCNSARRYEVKI